MHTLVAIEATPTQHKRLVDTLNKRKYRLSLSRAGYNIPHISEVKLYDIRAKKEIMPHILKDLGCSVLYRDQEKIKLLDVIRGKKNEKKAGSFLEGRFTYLIKYLMQRFAGHLRFKPINIATGPKNEFVNGWHYAYAIASIEDIDRGMGEEL